MQAKSGEQQWPLHLLHCFVANGHQYRGYGSLDGGQSDETQTIPATLEVGENRA